MKGFKISIWSQEYACFIYPNKEHDYEIRMNEDDNLIVFDNGTGRELEDYNILIGSGFNAPYKDTSIMSHVFEGDIVEYIYEWEVYEPDGDGYEDKQKLEKGVVRFKNGRFYLDGHPGCLSDYIICKGFRVIGNIYEDARLASDLNLIDKSS